MNEHEFTELVKQLVKYERRLSSLAWNFWRGIVYGLGFFIGSALLAALIIYILGRVEDGSAVGRYLQDFVEILRGQ
jgi:hypothetical protein